MSYICPKDGARVPSWMPRHFPCRADYKYYVAFTISAVGFCLVFFLVSRAANSLIASNIRQQTAAAKQVALIPTPTMGDITEALPALVPPSPTGNTPAPVKTPTKRPTAKNTTTEENNHILDAKGVEMVLIPAGNFTMGELASTGRDECILLYPGGVCDVNDFLDEEPRHDVYLDAFYMDQQEVSNAEYAACVNLGFCSPPEKTNSYTVNDYYGNPRYDIYPVVYITWYDAQNYCRWRGGRLPTEAEWEKAARGTNGLLYPWGNAFNGKWTNFCDQSCEFDWASIIYDDGYADTAPVNYYAEGESPYGVYNLAGNVWEWTADWYSGNYYRESPARNPTGPSSGVERVIRGGAWNTVGSILRSATRISDDPQESFYNIGFRCVADTE